MDLMMNVIGGYYQGASLNAIMKEKHGDNFPNVLDMAMKVRRQLL